MADRFIVATDWQPNNLALFAGALVHTRYGLLKRWVMQAIAGRYGGDTDTSRDFEYTDWDQVTRFAENFVRRLPASMGHAA